MERKKILLVDDENFILSSLERMLHSWAKKKNIEILTADSGARALEILKHDSSHTALIISDLRMPEMNGSDLLLQVKKIYPHIVTILLTGFAETEEMMKAIKAGIFSYIMKPWDDKYLLMEIEKALDVFNIREENRNYLALMKEELKWAGELQRTLLQVGISESDSIKFTITYTPLPELNCGGDYYDIILCRENMYLALIGDVAGHGVKAAFVTTILKSIIYRGYVKDHRDSSFSVSDFLSWLNNRLCDELKRMPDIVVTFSAALLDLDRNIIQYANAGHLPNYILREGQALKLHIPGTSLGFKKDLSYEEKSYEIASGDKIILYTDGLIEVDRERNISEHNFEKLLVDNYQSNPFNSALTESLKKMNGIANFIDDVTLISIDV